MIPNHNVAVITDPGELGQTLTELQQQPWVAIDTEFLRERTYYAQLCLVQIGTPDTAFCIDPLALDDLAPLRELLTNENITKVFHAAFQDLEILQQATGEVPRPVFDTQVGAALLGHADQIGYARLVQTMLGVELEKAHSRTDWTRRPLKPEVLEYAADDVHYLARLYPDMRDQLQQCGRLDWLLPEFAQLTDPERYRTHPQDAWQRVKGWKRLKPAQQQVLAPLAAWREQTAIHANRPRGWILKDDVLLELARRRPQNAQALADIRGLPGSVTQKHGRRLLDLIAQARQRPAEPLAPVPERLAPEQEPLVDLLMATLRARATEIDISPGALASRRDLEKIVAGNPAAKPLQGWRLQAVGQLLQNVLHGELAVSVSGEQLKVD